MHIHFSREYHLIFGSYWLISHVLLILVLTENVVKSQV